MDVAFGDCVFAIQLQTGLCLCELTSTAGVYLPHHFENMRIYVVCYYVVTIHIVLKMPGM